MQTLCCDEWSPETDVVTREGDRVCTRCGTVLESHMMFDFPPSFGDYGRVGEPNTMSDDTLEGTTLSGVKGVSRAVVMGHADDRARMWVHKGDDVIHEHGATLHLVDRTLSWARELLHDSLDREKVRSVPRLRCRAASCLYFACKIDGVDRGEHEVADALGIRRRDFQKSNKKVRDLLASQPYARAMLNGARPSMLVPRMLQGVLGLTDQTNAGHRSLGGTRKRLLELAESVEREGGLVGKKPQSVCAALIAFTFEKEGRECVISKLAEMCGVSTGALDGSLEELRILVNEKKILV